MFKYKGVLALALVCLALTISSHTLSPQPGAVVVSTNLKYLNNMFGLIFPITLQNILQQKTFTIGFTDKGFGYSVKINSIFVDKIAFDKKELGFVPGTNNTRLTITGFDINATIDGTIYALWIVPLSAAGMRIKNVSLVVDIAAPSGPDQVTWQIQDVIALDIQDF